MPSEQLSKGRARVSEFTCISEASSGQASGLFREDEPSRNGESYRRLQDCGSVSKYYRLAKLTMDFSRAGSGRVVLALVVHVESSLGMEGNCDACVVVGLPEKSFGLVSEQLDGCLSLRHTMEKFGILESNEIFLYWCIK